ncbi:MAG: NimC/NimA family protein [Bacteroidales bacterium]|nr:NimC/NimA family protein [Bacteroidales bacterium]
MMMEAVKRVYEFLEDAKTYYLATVENDQPRVRVYGTVLLFEESLYIMAFRRTNAVDQLKANPKAEIATFKGKQLRMVCRLVEDDRQEVKDAMAEKMPSLKEVAGEKNQNFVMLRVTEATATIADMAGHSETFSF